MRPYTNEILLKETIRAEARGYYKLKKQTGGPGQFAVVELCVRPLPPGGGFKFINSVVEGRIPDDFMPAVEKGVREGMLEGVVAGCPVVDVEVEVVDGDAHRRDSHARDFQRAARHAFQDALGKAKPALLEPLLAIEVVCPKGSLGAVAGRLSARRARIRGTDFRDDLHVVRAEAPALDLGGFDAELRSLTNGRGTMTVEPSRYDLMPESAQRLYLQDLKR